MQDGQEVRVCQASLDEFLFGDNAVVVDVQGAEDVQSALNRIKLEKPVLSDSVKVHTEWEQLGKVLMTLNAKSSILVTMLCRFG